MDPKDFLRVANTLAESDEAAELRSAVTDQTASKSKAKSVAISQKWRETQFSTGLPIPILVKDGTALKYP